MNQDNNLKPEESNQDRAAAEAEAIYRKALEGTELTEVSDAGNHAETILDEAAVADDVLSDIRFINRTNINEVDVKRLVDKIFSSKKGVKGYRVFLMIFGMLVCFYAGYSIFQGLTGDPATYILTGTFLMVMGIVMIYMAARGVVNQTYKRTLRNAQGFMTPRTYHFYDEEFSQASQSQNYSVKWAETSGWTEDERSFYILIGQSYAIVHKDGFTLGDASAFRDFLTHTAGPQSEGAGPA